MIMIDKFILGVFATIGVEAICFIIWALTGSYKNKGE